MSRLNDSSAATAVEARTDSRSQERIKNIRKHPPRQTRLTQAYFFFTGVLFADKALMS